MKIALISQEYPPETARGGIGTQTWLKARGLTRRGHRVFVISRSLTNERYERTDGLLTVIRIPGMDEEFHEMTDTVQWITHSVVVAAEIQRLQVREALDLLDFPEWGAEAYTYLLNCTPWNQIPTVIQLHGPLIMFGQALGWPDMASSFYRTGVHMEATCLQLADSVYTSSLCSAEWVTSGYQLNKPEIPVIHLGIDTTLFSPKKHLQNQHPTLVFVGKLVKNKGVEELVEAAIAIREEFPDLEVCLVGSGDASMVSSLKEKSKGVKNLLNFIGPVAKDQLPDILSKAHIFTAPSWYEGGPGFVYLEAMACGLPVIGCSGSGVEEIIRHGETGLLVPPRDTQALTESIRTLLRDTLLRQQLGAKARQYVVEEADYERCLEKLEAYYEKVCMKKAQNV